MAATVASNDMYKSFFLKNLDKGKTTSIDSAKVKAATIDNQYYQTKVLPNIAQLEVEADALYQVFKDSHHKKDELANSGLIEILVFTNQLLLSHYEGYKRSSSIAKYKNRIKELDDFAVGMFIPIDKKQESLLGRVDWLKAQVKENLNYIWALFAQPSTLRDQLGLSNISRVYWVFCHFCLNEIMLLVKDQDILDKIGELLGASIDLDKFSDALNSPNNILNVLSVVFFAGRLVVDLVMLAKHTYGSDVERSRSTAWQRFNAELDKRILNITNCTVWGGVNLVTNYYDKFGIPVEWAFPIVAGVLIFDVTLVQLNRSKDKAVFDSAINNITSQLNDKEIVLESGYRLILEKQRAALEDKWQIKEQSYLFNTIAAAGLLISFSLSLVITPPLAILGCYMVGCVSVAMYASNNELEAYAKASKRKDTVYNYQERKGIFSAKECQQLADKENSTYKHLQKVILERAFAPLALFILMGINPVIGLSMSAAYMLYSVNNRFNESNEAKAEETIELHQFSLA